MARGRKVRQVKTKRSDTPVTYINIDELVNRLAAKTKVRKIDCKEMINALGDVVRETIYMGQSVKLPGIGRLEYGIKTSQRFDPYNQRVIPARPYPKVKYILDAAMAKAIRRAFDAERERRLSADADLDSQSPSPVETNEG